MQQSTIISSDYYTAVQLAKELNIDLRTLWRWKSNHRCPPSLKDGALCLFPQRGWREVDAVPRG